MNQDYQMRLASMMQAAEKTTDSVTPKFVTTFYNLDFFRHVEECVAEVCSNEDIVNDS